MQPVLIGLLLLLPVVFACSWWLGRAGTRNRLSLVQGELNGKDQLLAEVRAQLASALAALETERSCHAGSQARLHTIQAQAETQHEANQEKVAALLAFEERVKSEFGALATDVLDANARRLTELSLKELEKQRLATAKELGEKESSICMLLKPMSDSLKHLTEHTRELEVKRQGAYESIAKEIELMRSTHFDLRRETSQLVQALRAPKSRGNWGEMQLRRCVEYAGMLEHASFDVEKTVRGEDATIRPDLIVHLPNRRCVIVDAKTPLDAFLNASGAEDETVRQRHLAEHAAAVRGHLNALAGKAYWSRFSDSPDFVVCFLPSEVLFSAALEQDPSLLEHSAGGKVLLATPTTLIALLKAVAYGWQQADIARDAQVIRDAAVKVHKKLADMHTDFLSLGTHLRKAGECYDSALVKADGRGGLFSIARQLRELKIGEKDLPDAKAVAFRPRLLEHEDWHTGLSLAAAAEKPERN